MARRRVVVVCFVVRVLVGARYLGLDTLKDPTEDRTKDSDPPKDSRPQPTLALGCVRTALIRPVVLRAAEACVMARAAFLPTPAPKPFTKPKSTRVVAVIAAIVLLDGARCA